jgi:prepilin-type N-terminal cleavage/methylation domain-containing protein
MKENYKTIRKRRGFSLAEMLVALTISAMVLAAVISIYSRAERSAAAVTRSLDDSRLPSEVIQRVAEDLDKIITPNSDARITIENKFDRGLPTARMTIQKTIYDTKNEQQTFEEIIWQANYDYDTGAKGLALYRSHTGMVLEDKLLDEKRDDWEKNYSFVPICTGITFFKIQIPIGENLQERWVNSQLPPGIAVTISFAEPFETASGTLDVPEAEKITRVVAIDRTRRIRFEIPADQEEKEKAEEGEGIKVKQEEKEKSNEKEKSKQR